MSAIHGDISRYDPAPLAPISSHNNAAPAPTSTQTPRERLKHAFAGVELARTNFQTAQGLAVKATKMLETARTTFQQSQFAEHDIREWKIKAFKDNSAAPMPPDLIEARREAIHAAQELEHADALAGQMGNELAAAERAFQDAEKFKREAACACVVEEAKVVIEEIKQLGDRRKYLRNILRGISLAGTSQVQYREFEALRVSALHDPSIAELAFPPAAPGSTKYWGEFSQALLSNPDAKLGEPPAADKLWS
jgi:hypothetical protein